MEQSILDYALAYAEIGAHVLFVKPNKQPFLKRLGDPITVGGADSATTDAETITRRYAEILRSTGEPPALALVARGDWLFVDVDIKEDDGNESLHYLERLLGELPETVHYTTPSGGHHYLFRVPDHVEVSNITEKRLQGVGIRTKNQYVVTAPSPGYEFDQHPEDIEWTIPDIPHAWVAHFLISADDRKPLLDRHASDELHPSERHGGVLSLGADLRHLGLSTNVIEAALIEYNRTTCKPPKEDSEVRDIAEWCGKQESKYIKQQIIAAEAAKFDDGPKDNKESEPKLPEHLLHPGGILEQMCDYTLDRSHFPQPALTLGAMLSTLGTISGNRIVTKSGAFSNLYTLGVAPTGAGKDAARKCGVHMIRDAFPDTYDDDGRLISYFRGPTDFTSDSAIMTLLSHKNRFISYLDEIGHFFAGVKSRNAMPHAANIPKVLMELFTSAGDVYESKGYADISMNITIRHPLLCLYMTTTGETLWSTLNSGDVMSGFLPRTLLFTAGDVPRNLGPRAMDEPPDRSITRGLQRIENIRDEMEAAALADWVTIPRDSVVGPYWAEMVDYFDQKKIGGDNVQRAFYTRAAQLAEKIALIHAVSLWAVDEGPFMVTLPSVQYGVELAKYNASAWQWHAKAHVSDNEIERIKKRVLDIVRSTGAKGVTQNEITRRTQFLKDKLQRDSILSELIAAGYLKPAERQTKTKAASVLIHYEFFEDGGVSEFVN